MRKVQILIEGERLELFEDEKVQVQSSVQDISDISKVFTDYSQEFTVPASVHNNQLFEHFYQSDVDGTLDYQIRRDARIEIDTITFRIGRLQLEKSNLKEGKPYSYSLRFYGDVVSLKDLIGETKLNELDLTSITHEYTGADVYNRVVGSTDYDIRYPLITSSRVWDYAGPDNTNNIDNNAGKIVYTELFPAIKIARIFDAIQNDFGVTFIGNFLTDKRFDNCFLWCKNSLAFEAVTNSTKVDFITTNNTTAFNVTDNTLHYTYQPTVPTVNAPVFTGTHTVNISMYNVSNTATIYYIDVFVNGALYTTIQGSGNNTYNVFTDANTVGLDKTVRFEVKAQQSMTYKTNCYYDLSLQWLNSGVLETELIQSYAYGSNLMLTAGNVNIGQYMPDMKVNDFIAGVLKEFNLTCYPTANKVYKVEPLDDWYASGYVYDITKYTDIDSIEIERVKLYKRIAFKHEVSNSVTNVDFSTKFGQEYGDLSYQYPYDGEEFVVSVPFENLLFNQFTGTNIQVAYSVDKDLKPYITKPVLLYLYEQTTTSNFKFNDGSTTHNVTSYYPFGQDLMSNNVHYSLNFGNDISSLTLENVPNGLFQTYYFEYLSNLYNRKNRMTHVKTTLPISILTSLQLNDRLIIRDKRYIINSMSCDLTAGTVDFVLLNDYRKLRIRRPIIGPISGGEIGVPIKLPNKVETVTIDVGTTGVTAVPDTFTEDGYCAITIPSSTTPKYYILLEDGSQFVTEQGDIVRSEEGDTNTIVLPITYTFTNGETETDYLIITQ